MYDIKLDSPEPLVFLMISSSDHISPALGLSPTVVISKNGGAFAAVNGAVTEIGDGWYVVAADDDDQDTLGPLILHATAGGADPTDVVYHVVNGLVDLGPTQTTTIIGNIQGSVANVTNPVTCKKKSCSCCCGC
jgi:hypothetical protein